MASPPQSPPSSSPKSGQPSRSGQGGHSGPACGPLLRQIKASAGSGKTYDLTRRFLLHLSQSSPRVHVPACGFGNAPQGNGAVAAAWGDILAATFTNSAAAEMQERVIRQLKEIALGKGAPKGVRISPAQAAQWVDSILRQLSALNIRTIDSFLHMVVRMSALDLGLPPDFVPSFSTEESLSPLLDASIEQAWQGDADMQRLLRGVCRGLLFHTDTKGFMVGSRITQQVMGLMNEALTEDWSSLADEVALVARHSAYVQRFSHSAEALRQLVQDEGLKIHASAMKAIVRAEQGDVKAASSVYLSKDSLEDCVLKASVGMASPVAARAYEALREAAVALATDGHILKRALELAPFVALTAKVAEGLESFQQEEGTIPGARIPHLAAQVLSEGHGVSEALCRMGTRLTHIMLDEFQDTSRLQWQALLPLVQDSLSRGGSLTWVGDVKQAIYGWRGGDAALFDDLLAPFSGLHSTKPQVITDVLPTNWRSREAIVSFNNSVFSQLTNLEHAVAVLYAMLPKHTPPQQVGTAAALLASNFEACGQTVPARPASKGGCVRVEEVEGENSAHLDTLVRERLCQLLQQDIAPRRPWSEVTILVRSNTAASKVAAWLMDIHIPVVTENSLLLAEHPLVLQSVAFLSFLDAPQDDLAFWTLVSGTVFTGMSGLDPAALCDWAATREGGLQGAKGTSGNGGAGRTGGMLCQAFRKDFPAVWDTWLAPFDAMAGLMTPYDTVQEFFAHFAVLERFPAAETFLRRFLEVVHRAECNGRATLGTFLEHWQGKGGEEKLPMPENMDAVRIMTIHKSKGLQFPVVIVPWTAFTPRPESPPVRMLVDDLDVLAPRCKEMGPLYYDAMADMARESVNLLYVAFTRAVDELYVFATKTPALQNMAGMAQALDVLWPLAELTLPIRKGKALTTKAAPTQSSLFNLFNGVAAAVPAAPAAAEPSVSVQAVPPATLAAGVPATRASSIAPETKAAQRAPVAEAAHAQSSPASTSPTVSKAPTGPMSSGASPTAPKWRPMGWLPQLKIFRNPLQAMQVDARQRGILAHACLEYFQWTGQPRVDVQRAVEQGMRLFAGPQQEKDALIADIGGILHWYVSLPEAPYWLQHGVPEQSIMDAQGQLHRVDVLVTTPHGPVAVDYKTGSPAPKDISQMQGYLELLAQLDPLHEPSAVLVYLDAQQCRRVTRSTVFDLSAQLDALPAGQPDSGPAGQQGGALHA